ncbi:MAG: hypothetical protein LBI10_08030 [Deltaproteobacteria bacterium]|jgi:hypothetical protein|nr:hypothetical protein [Deltaproteobacteria bacterium]
MASESNERLIQLLENIQAKDPNNALLAQLFKRHDESTVRDLVLDLRKDASNTLGWFFDEPVDYDECVVRVAKKIGVDEDDLTNDEIQNELIICQAVFKKYLVSLDPKEAEQKKEEIFEEIGDKYKEFASEMILGSTTAFLAIVQVIGPKVVQGIMLRVIGRVLAGQAAINVSRLAFTVVPILNVIMGVWLALDITGPAYRKIIPSVCNIAFLRLFDAKKINFTVL